MLFSNKIHGQPCSNPMMNITKEAAAGAEFGLGNLLPGGGADPNGLSSGTLLPQNITKHYKTLYYMKQ